MNIDFKVFKSNIKIPIKMGILINLEDLADANLVEKYRSSSFKTGIMWTYDNQIITKKNENVNIIGRPTTDFKYIVAVYMGINGEYNPPQNCAIYNLDGSIHKILEIPSLKSPIAIKRLEFLNEQNPPTYVANFGYPINFSGCGWEKLEDGKIVNFIAIDYDGELWETRVLDPETGEIGDLIHYGKN